MVMRFNYAAGATPIDLDEAKVATAKMKKAHREVSFF